MVVILAGCFHIPTSLSVVFHDYVLDFRLLGDTSPVQPSLDRFFYMSVTTQGFF